MNYLIAIILIFSAWSYAESNSINQVERIDQTFMIFVEDFAARSNGRLSVDDIKRTGVIIQFSDLEYSEKESGTIGLCTFAFLGEPPIIEIDRKYWDESDIYQQWQLIFHELGHCVLERGHTLPDYKHWFINFLNSLGIENRRWREFHLPDGCPKSIMNPTAFPTYCLKTHQKYYSEEMFSSKGELPIHIRREW